MTRLCQTLVGFTAVTFYLAAADCVPRAVSPDFHYQGKPIHPGCIDELTTQPNGDNIAATVNLGRTPDRGCMDSNLYAMDATLSSDGFLEYKQAGSGDVFGYRHVREIAPGIHHLEVREVSQGSYRSLTSLFVRYHLDSVLEIDGHGVTTKSVDRLSTVGSANNKRDLGASDYARIRAALGATATPRFCAAPAAK